MKLTKCNSGHFYDADKFSACPICSGGGAADDNVTVSFQSSNGAELSKTVPLLEDVDLTEELKTDPAPASDLDDDKTISIFNTALSDEESEVTAPVTGWLVCVKGKHFGKAFTLVAGRNFIGRNADMEVCLSGESSVSRSRHAIVVYEPKQNIFIAQAGDSRELTYVNGDIVLVPTPLKKNDVLQIGDVELMLIPCCDDKFSWQKK